MISKRTYMPISKRAKVTSDKPAYTKKEKTDSGNYVWRYTEEHVEKRWKEKKDKMKSLDKNLKKVREKYEKDLASDDEKTRAIAAIVGIMDDTAMRIGNEDSAKEGTYGASTLKVKHVKGKSGNITFDFPGKGAIEQNVVLKNKKVIKVVRDLMKGKKADDFIFEIDGSKIWDRTVNRYLKEFDISAKDLRGFHANRLMKEQLKKKDFKDALKEVADIVGHEEATLKNQYLDPALVEKHEGKEKKKASISIRAFDDPNTTPSLDKTIKDLVSPSRFGPDSQTKEQNIGTSKQLEQPEPIQLDPALISMLGKNVGNMDGDISNYPDLQNAWRIIAPFLPEGAKLTNGWRGDNDQAKIIIEYWRSAIWPNKNNDNNTWLRGKGFFKTQNPDVGNDSTLMWWHKQVTSGATIPDKFYRALRRDLEPLRVIMTEYKPSGLENEPPVALKIAPLGTSKHLSGEAFDVSGVSLSSVVKAANYINANLGDSVQFTKILPERGQQAVHLVVNKGVRLPNNHELALALQDYAGSTVAKASISRRAELTTEDAQWVDSIKVSPSTPGGAQRAAPNLRQSLRIGPNVKLNKLILDAWKTLQPFLPAGAMMTSGFRTPEDQKTILENYWQKATGTRVPEHLKSDERTWRQISKILDNQYGFVVGPPTTKSQFGHLKGNAFDISGADLSDIANAVIMVSNDRRLPVKFRRPRVEDRNNAVHVGVESAIYDEAAIARVSQEHGVRVASISKYAEEENSRSQLVDTIYQDLLDSDASEDVIKEFEETFGIKKASLECHAEEEHDVLGIDDMGFGIADELGDWFEKSPIFRWREDIPEFEIHDVDASEAKKLAEDDPEKFFYRGLHKQYPDFESVALKGMLENNAKFFFIFLYHEREEEAFQDLVEKAAEALSLQDARAFFYYHLHHKFPELGRGAIVQLIDTNPESFHEFGLGKDYPDYLESANNAINIEDSSRSRVIIVEDRDER